MIVKTAYRIISMGLAAIIMSFVWAPRHTLQEGELNIAFVHKNGQGALKLDTLCYRNGAGQAYSVSKFRYYISGITLKRKGGGEYTSPEFFLVDEEDAASKSIRLKHIPEGIYESVSFTLGVDSLHNCSGAQSGALDPVHGMFWAWNTGYIFLKLEGHSPASSSPGNIFEYHIGGYLQPSNCIRTISLTPGNKSVDISKEKPAGMRICADVSALLLDPNPVDFSRLSSVTGPWHATEIADNYARMFRLINPD